LSLSIGVDVGGTKVLGVAVDADGELVGEPSKVPTPKGGDAIVDAIVTTVTRLAGETSEVASLGVGLPGLVDRRGVLRMGPNVPDVVDYPFRAALSDRLDRPVTVDNDATCAMWAEHERGVARGFDDVLLVALGTGIGGGLFIGGQLQRGTHGFAGEPGHVVVDPGGPLCPCGRRGCWERFASGSGLGRLAREYAQANRGHRMVELAGGDAEEVKGEHVTRAAAEGDPEALEVIREFGWWFALGIANFVNLLDPALVVVGGGLIEAGELLLEPARVAFKSFDLFGSNRPDVPIVAAQLGEEAGAVGAALLGAARAVTDPRVQSSGT
jgi:glucokinase